MIFRGILIRNNGSNSALRITCVAVEQRFLRNHQHVIVFTRFDSGKKTGNAGPNDNDIFINNAAGSSKSKSTKYRGIIDRCFPFHRKESSACYFTCSMRSKDNGLDQQHVPAHKFAAASFPDISQASSNCSPSYSGNQIFGCKMERFIRAVQTKLIACSIFRADDKLLGNRIPCNI